MISRRFSKLTALMLMFVMISGLSLSTMGWVGKANAAAPLFSDGFESGFSGWNVWSGFTSTMSTSKKRVHNGMNSYAVDENQDAIVHTMAGNTNKVVSIWFYDTADASAKVIAMADNNVKVVGIGIDSGTSNTYYSYRIDNTFTATTITRTTGWHNLVFDYRTGPVELYIDNTLIATTSIISNFNRIALGDLWNANSVSDFFFDDISVQDDLPWTVFTPPGTPTPTPARYAYLNDSFENGITGTANNWINLFGVYQVTPAPSTTQKHGTGLQSYKPNYDKDAIQSSWSSATRLNKVVVVWFYDDAADTSLRAMAFADTYLSATSIVGLGVNTETSTTKYSFQIGTTTTATNINRVSGWHSLAFDYRSGTGVTLKIDGTTVLNNDPVEIAYRRIALGDFWNDGLTGNVYFDDVLTQDYAPGEPTVTPTPSPTPTPTPIPATPLPTAVGGVWFSENFENVTLPNTIWQDSTSNLGTPTTNTLQNHTVGGTSSYELNQDYDAIKTTLSSTFQKVAVIWMYDDAADLTVKTYGNVDDNYTGVGIGVDTGASIAAETQYVTKLNGTVAVTGITRTTGWHQFVYDYRSGTGPTLYIDQMQVATASNPKSFNKIFIGDNSAGVSSTTYFDDISVQNTLPWELPPGVSFQEGFESTLSQWTTSWGTASVSVAPIPKGNSYSINEDQDVIAHTRANTNKVAVVQFYDHNTSNTPLKVMAYVDTPTTTVGLGVNTVDNSSSYYVYRLGTTNYTTTVPRSTGWHTFAFDYRSGTDVSLYIDNILIVTTPYAKFFSKISLGDFWTTNIGNVFFDNVSIQEYLPNETFPFTTTSPAAVINAAMGFEAAGDWRTEAYILEDNPTFVEAELRSKLTTPYRSLDTLQHGFTLSTTNVRQGTYSLKWENHPFYPTLSTRNVQADWSNSNMISFWAYSETITNEEISMVIYSDNVATPYQDFFHYTFKVNWTGWQEVKIPLAAFTSYGAETAGWNSVQAIHFSSKLFEKQPSPGAVLYMDEMKLSSVSVETINSLMPPATNTMTNYITKYPNLNGFVNMTFDSFMLYVNNKIEYQTADTTRQAAITTENNAILTSYGLGNTDSSYSVSDFVVTQNKITATHEAKFDPSFMNHTENELLNPPTGFIQYEAYWKSERALYKYYPKFNSAPVSIAPNGKKYLQFGNSIIQSYSSSKSKWFYNDLEPVFQTYVTANHSTWSAYKHRDLLNTAEGKIRFDSAGHAYMLALIQEVKSDGTSGAMVHLLLYSNDKLKTWKVYGLEHPFAKFEQVGTFNTEALTRPPVITMDNSYLADPRYPLLTGQAGYVTIPTKNNNGTLTIPTAIKFCETCTENGTLHSGNANIAITSNNTLFLTYGVIELETAPTIPTNHPSNLSSCLIDPLPGSTIYFPCKYGTPSYVVKFTIDSNGLLTNKSSPTFLGYAGRGIDGHNWPALNIDSNGRLHAILNGHQAPFTYMTSTNPLDITSWSTPVYIGDGHSYATIDMSSTNKLFVITRDTHGDSKYNLKLSTKDGNAANNVWSVQHQKIVERMKQFYEVFYNRTTYDPATGYIYVSYYSQSRQSQMFKDEYDAMIYIYPDREKMFNPNGNNAPIGNQLSGASRVYKTLLMPASEPTTLISTDGGASFRLTKTTDY